MTCPVLTPWTRRARRARCAAARPGPAADAVSSAHIERTAILDCDTAPVRRLLEAARRAAAGPGGRELLAAAHGLISGGVIAVYALDDTQPASLTLTRGRGSCSQRFAVLEAVARAAGVPTRVRGLLVDGRFWYPRFPRLRALVPDQVVLAWPEFHLGGRWVTVSELFGSLPELSRRRADGFTNGGGETLFDAVRATAVDWDGAAGCGTCDLSAVILADFGHYESRDRFFAEFGQTLCRPARALADPLLSRRQAV